MTAPASETPMTPADVILLITPTGPNTASAGVVYRKRVSHERVRQELGRLARETGAWIGRDVQIDDVSVHPDDTRRYPITTGAQFTLIHIALASPKVPSVIPYLSAFQSWNHVEVIFALPSQSVYSGADHFDSPAMTLQLNRDPGAFRFDADIRDHQNLLPNPPDVVNASAPTHEASSHENSHSALLWPIFLIIAGIGLIGGAGVYLLMSRRAANTRVSARTLRL